MRSVAGSSRSQVRAYRERGKRTDESLLEAAVDISAALAASAAENDRSGMLPRTSFQRLAEAGLLGLTVATPFGGRGAGLDESIRVLGAIARGDPSIALILAFHYMHHATIGGRWPSPIVERLGREAVAGISPINALRVESDLGTPARGGLPATTAHRTSDGWRLSGRKIYSTGGRLLSWLAVWARTNEAESRVGTFLVPAKTPGVQIIETWDQLGMRASASHDVVLEDVSIPREFAVDIRPPSAWAQADPGPTAWSMLLVATVYHGVAEAARDWFLHFIKERAPTNLGSPLASQPRFQEAAGEIEARLLANTRLLASAALDVDAGRPPPIAECGLLKLTVSNNAIAAVETAVKLTGNPGLSKSNPLERHYRDVLCARIHTPQDDAARIAAGRAALGLS